MCKMRLKFLISVDPNLNWLFISAFQMRTLRGILALLSEFKCLRCEKGNHDRDRIKIHLREAQEKNKVS